jgi:hypothetical protein
MLGDSGDGAVDGSSSEQDVVSTQDDNVSVHIGLDSRKQGLGRHLCRPLVALKFMGNGVPK